MIEHPFLPCFYADPPERRWIAEAQGLCLNPDGIDQCHINGCGRPVDEHRDRYATTHEAREAGQRMVEKHRGALEKLGRRSDEA